MIEVSTAGSYDHKTGSPTFTDLSIGSLWGTRRTGGREDRLAEEIVE